MSCRSSAFALAFALITVGCSDDSGSADDTGTASATTGTVTMTTDPGSSSSSASATTQTTAESSSTASTTSDASTSTASDTTTDATGSTESSSGATTESSESTGSGMLEFVPCDSNAPDPGCPGGQTCNPSSCCFGSGFCIPDGLPSCGGFVGTPCDGDAVCMIDLCIADGTGVCVPPMMADDVCVDQPLCWGACPD